MRVVFVHGAFVRDGAWWWAPAARLLSQRGIASTAVALPSCGEAGARAARAARVVELAITRSCPGPTWSPPRSSRRPAADRRTA
jgi:hypothetical protein